MQWRPKRVKKPPREAIKTVEEPLLTRKVLTSSFTTCSDTTSFLRFSSSSSRWQLSCWWSRATRRHRFNGTGGIKSVESACSLSTKWLSFIVGYGATHSPGKWWASSCSGRSYSSKFRPRFTRDRPLVSATCPSTRPMASCTIQSVCWPIWLFIGLIQTCHSTSTTPCRTFWAASISSPWHSASSCSSWANTPRRPRRKWSGDRLYVHSKCNISLSAIGFRPFAIRPNVYVPPLAHRLRSRVLSSQRDTCHLWSVPPTGCHALTERQMIAGVNRWP